MAALSLDEFKDFLIENGYSEYSDSGNQSTAFDYPKRIKAICEREGFVLSDNEPDLVSLSADIDDVISKYDHGGSEETFGSSSKRAPINALKRLKEYSAGTEANSGDSVKPSTNPELDMYTVKAVVDKLADSNSPITYGELAKRVGELRGRPIANQGFAYTLGRIQDYCLELELPSLPVMVVDQTLKPAHGFVNHYRAIHQDAAELTDGEIIRQERMACIACKSWQRLYDRVGLVEKVPAIHNLIAEQENKPVYEEGARITDVLRTEIKRNPEARLRCLAIKGHRCIVCEKDMEEVYGIPGIVHVHHLKPIFETAGVREVDPERDLVPVCPNCHAAIHSKGSRECYTPNEVRGKLGLPPLERY